jgi:chromosomal replication initiator protein DnaA
MITSWELKFFPTKEYQNRYRLRIKCEPEDVEELLSFLKDELNLSVSSPFNVLSSSYNVGVYINNLSEEIKTTLVEKLFSVCSNGKVEDKTLQEEESKKEKSFPEDLESVLTSLVEQVSSKVVEPDLKGVITEKKETQQKTVPFVSMPLNPKYTFENFVVGANNRFTHAAALAVAENPGKTYNPLFIYGGVGLGKTHLMQAIGHYIKKKYPLMKVVYIPTDKFVAQVIEAIRNGTIQQLRDFYSNVDVLLVDDVQFMAGSESTQEEFFHIFNTLHQLGKQIVLTSDRPPKLLSTLEDRLRSRFEWGLIADIKSPSLETRVAILKKKSEEENVNVDDNILLYVASKLKSNIRELEGFLKRITAYAALNNQPIDMNLVKQLMSELLPEEELTEEEKTILQTQQQKYESVSQQPSFKTTPVSTQPVIQQQPTSSPQQKVKPKTISVEEIYGRSKQSSTSVSPQQPTVQPQIPSVDEQKLYQNMSDVNAVEVAFFYPENAVQELALVKQKFAEVIKKHNLKYKLVTAFDRPYSLENINYKMFAELCKTNKVNICIVLSPPPDSHISAEEFYNNLLPQMESESIVLEYISWKELNKEYRYLNLALDIALSKLKII